MQMATFKYLEPKTIEEATHLLSKYGAKAKILAGGTDLIVSMNRNKIKPDYIIYLGHIPDLDYIKYSLKDGLRVGALATHRAISSSGIVKKKYPLLAMACGRIGTPHIRNMGTIGGNLCNAGPSADTPPALLVLDARLRLVSDQKERIIPIDQFFIAPFRTALGETELATEIQIPPLPTKSAGTYQWASKITTVDETLVGVAVLMVSGPAETCRDIRIGLSSVAPIPMRARQAEEMLRGNKVTKELVKQTALVASGETKPRSRADYRRRMTMILVRDAINEVWQRIK